MKTTTLLIDGHTEITLKEFIKANTHEGVCSIDPEDIATIENLQVDQVHYIACDNDFAQVKKIIDTDSLSPFERFQLEKYGNILGIGTPSDHEQETVMSTTEEAYVYQIENPE